MTSWPHDLHDICCGVVCEKIFDYQLFIYRLMDVFDIILHEHIYQKQDVITLFPLKSHLIFGFSALQNLPFCITNAFVEPKKCFKNAENTCFFPSHPYLFQALIHTSLRTLLSNHNLRHSGPDSTLFHGSMSWYIAIYNHITTILAP